MFPTATRFLIVDDMAAMRAMVKQALQSLGFKNIAEASDGAMAFKLLESAREMHSPVEFIISDWNMPKFLGIDFLRKVRGVEWGLKMPFILLTAETEKKNVMEALQAGVDSYLIKPFTVDQLRSKLNQTYMRLHPEKKSAS